MGGRQVAENLVDQRTRALQVEAIDTRADPRIREQGVDQLLHPQGAVHREPDELVGVAVELAAVPPPQ